MAVYWKKDTAFTIYRLPGSRRQISEKLNARTQREADLEDAVRHAGRLKEWGLMQQGKPHEPQQIAWKALVDKYMDVSEGNGNASPTMERKKHHFRHIDGLIGIVLASEWTIETLEDFKLRSRREGTAPGVTNKELGYIKAVLRLGRRLKKVVMSGEDADEVKQVEDNPPTPPFMLADDQTKLMQVASPFWRIAVLLGGLGGLRRGEVLGVRWEDIKFATNEMVILDRIELRTKTRISKTVPLHAVLREALHDWRAANPKETMVAPWDKGANEFSKAFKRLAKKAGVRGSFKSLRHGFGTGLMKLDVHLVKIQKAMGHASVKTTEKYLHAQVVDVRAGINKLRSPMERSDETSNHFLTKYGFSADSNNDRPTKGAGRCVAIRGDCEVKIGAFWA